MASPGIVVEDPAASPESKDEAWRAIGEYLDEAIRLARQAVGQTNDPYLKAYANALAGTFEAMAAAADAQDLEALDAAAAAQPDLPEPPPGTPTTCGF